MIIVLAAILVLLGIDRPSMNSAAAVGSPNSSVGGPAAPLDSTGGGSIHGTVKLIGQPPKAMALNMAQEPVCAKQHSSPVTAGDVVTGEDGTLVNVVVYVSAGLGDRHFEPPSQPIVLDQKGCMYSPHILTIQVNQKLQVVNSDPTSHNIHPVPTNNREWNKSQPPSTPPIETSFSREEISVPVKCNVHPWMRGYVAVFKHPYFATTGKEGSFELRNLPPGTYTITAWHEKFGTSEQQVTVAQNESKKVDFTFKPRSY